MKSSWYLLLCFLTLGVLAVSAEQTSPSSSREVNVLLVVGAAGTEQYGKLFERQVTAWEEACSKAGLPIQIIGRGKPDDDAAQLEAALSQASSQSTGQFWLVMIGHGTFDGREAKFNLRGPDVTARQSSDWLRHMKRELVLIQTASASGGFIASLTGKNRIVVTATKSADEIFYTRFGEYFAPAIAGLAEADLDHDKQVSVLEAFLFASKKTSEFYEAEGRLATEHALLEDNGNGVGTRFEVFQGVEATDPKADGRRAAQVALVLSEEEQKLTEAQRHQRDVLERELDALKSRRADLGEDRYYADLETLMRKLAEVYR